MQVSRWLGLVVSACLCTALPAGAQAPVGALAIDEGQGDQWGWAVDYETASAARARALGEGGSGCSKRGLDDVSGLLRDLNEARKSVAYGDIGLPELDAEDVASRIVIGSAIRPGVASDDLDVMVLCRDVAQLRAKAPIDIDVRRADFDCAEDKIRAGHDLDAADAGPGVRDV